MTHDSSHTELNRIATDYFLRRREPDWSDADEAQLKEWLKADPKHTTIYANVTRTWASLGKVPRPVLASDAVMQAQPVSPVKAAPAPKRPATAPAWREFGLDAPLAGAGSAQQPGGFERGPRAPGGLAGWFGRLVPVVLVAVGGGAGWHWWDTTPGYSQTIAHRAQHPRTLDLPDGSHIVLNTGSDIEVRYYPRRREVLLASGEAFFQVAADAKRPFTVDTGPSRVTLVSTAFNVRAAPPAMQVKVQEGEVHVHPNRETSRRVLVLKAGKGISITPDGSQYTAIATEADTVGDWRKGQLIFRRTQLQTVVEELQRYTRQPIRLDKDQRLISLPVTGSTITSHPETFLQALPQMLPVRVRQRDGAWVITRR